MVLSFDLDWHLGTSTTRMVSIPCTVVFWTLWRCKNRKFLFWFFLYDFWSYVYYWTFMAKIRKSYFTLKPRKMPDFLLNSDKCFRFFIKTKKSYTNPSQILLTLIGCTVLVLTNVDKWHIFLVFWLQDTWNKAKFCCGNLRTSDILSYKNPKNDLVFQSKCSFSLLRQKLRYLSDSWV